MNLSRLLLLLVIVSCIASFFYFDLQQFLTLEMLKSKQAEILNYRAAHPAFSMMLYGLIYIVVTGLSLPGAAILTLAGGAVFGLLWGTVIVGLINQKNGLSCCPSESLGISGVQTKYRF